MNADAAVDAGDAIPVSRFRGGRALDGDHADAGAGGELVLEPQHRVRHRPLRARAVGEDLQRAHRDGADPTGDPAATHDRDRLPQGVDADAPSEEEIDRLWRARREDAGVFQEEGAFLRKEQRKAGEIRALLIDFDLREVRVVGQIESQAGRHTVFDLSADIAPALGLRVDREVAFDAGQRVWRGRQDPARRHAHPCERSRVRDLHQRELARDERPERFFILAADRAHEVEPPRLLLARRVAQRGEGNAELGIPAGRVHRRGHGPRPVPVEIEAAERPGAGARLPRKLNPATLALVHDLRVVLDRRRRGGEDETVLPVVIGVEQDPKVVALGDVAVAHFFARDDP